MSPIVNANLATLRSARANALAALQTACGSNHRGTLEYTIAELSQTAPAQAST
jgi:hypothetical protein